MSKNIPKSPSVKIISISVGSEFYGLGDDGAIYKYVRRYGGNTGIKYDDAIAEWVKVVV